jgi:hypothetical protein
MSLSRYFSPVLLEEPLNRQHGIGKNPSSPEKKLVIKCIMHKENENCYLGSAGQQALNIRSWLFFNVLDLSSLFCFFFGVHTSVKNLKK